MKSFFRGSAARAWFKQLLFAGRVLTIGTLSILVASVPRVFQHTDQWTGPDAAHADAVACGESCGDYVGNCGVNACGAPQGDENGNLTCGVSGCGEAGDAGDGCGCGGCG